MEIISYFNTVRPEWWLRQIGESDWVAGQFLYQLLRENRLREHCGAATDLLLLTDGSTLAAFCTYAEKDEIPDTDLAPWLGFAYTYPPYRGRRLMGRLISEVRRKAREDGKDTLYISTGETGLYEKYGAEFLTVMEGSYGETRVYRMDTYGFAGWETADAQASGENYPGIRTPRDLYNALWHVWSAETCAPRMRKDWSGENRTLGQCSVTAFLAQDIFGGKVYGIPLEDGGFHCYNVAGGRTFDLTSEQFPGQKLRYADNPEQLRYEHFRKEEKRARYETLKKALKAYTEGGRG